LFTRNPSDRSEKRPRGVHRPEPNTLFRRHEVDRNRDDATSTLESEAAVALVEQEVLAGGEKKRAEAATIAIGASEILFLDEARKEGLRQILRFLEGMTTAPDEGEDRVPVKRAKARQRLLGLSGAAFSRGEHERPLRSRKATATGLHG
jgi:hypothetical protein